ncbi:MAG: phosphatase PAP2 family protein [Carboxylicivirga sp.]|nr:phosphatase PAP2 family protein [Carboxylicivirga sp.]
MSKRLTLMAFSLIFINYCQGQRSNTIPTVGYPSSQSKAKSIILPSLLITTGIAIEYFGSDIKWWLNKEGIQNRIIGNAPAYQFSFDDYLQYAPIVMVAGMNLYGSSSRSMYQHQIKTLLLAEAICIGTVYGLKYSIGNLRPDGSTYNSFPSGHTAQAFLAARFLDKEYGHQSIWIRLLGYSMATTTGLSRIVKNRHWATDVLVGAGIGILSVDLSYWLLRKKKTNRLTLVPVKMHSTYGISMSYKF